MRSEGGSPLLLLLAALPTAVRAEATVPTAQQQCFQVQFLLRLPGLEAQHFLHAVQSLRDLDSGDEVGAARRITELSGEATALRRDEAQAFTQAAALLNSMSATAPLQSWAASEADRLGGPLPYSKDEAKQARTEPEVAAILATLDEADALKTDTDRHLATLGLWVNLTQGRAGLWAGDIGEVAAALHVALARQEPPRLSVTLARHLRAAAPAGTPPGVGAALGLLSPAAGNLSDLAPDATAAVPLPDAAQAHDALLAAFDARHLLPAASAPKP